MSKRRLEELFPFGDLEALAEAGSSPPKRTHTRPDGGRAQVDDDGDVDMEDAENSPVHDAQATARQGSTHNSPIQKSRYLPKQHNIKDHFSVFNALLSRVDVLLDIIKYLPPRTIVNLYSISAPFNYQFNSHYGAFILAATKVWAPQAEIIHPWRCYGSLCIPDPSQRLPSFYRSRAAATGANSSFVSQPLPKILPPHVQPSVDASQPPIQKMVPSLRWLTMVVYRTLVCREIVAYLTAAGFPVPPVPTGITLRKMWFLMDLQTNAHRIALIHNNVYFTNFDLYHIQHFCIKLDMHYTDPIAFTGGEKAMRIYLLSERTLTTLWDYLRGADGVNRLDILRLWVKHGWSPRVRRGPHPETKETQEAWDYAAYTGEASVLGVPLVMCGKWGNELKGLGFNKLLRPDELALRESVRRDLDLQKYMFRMMRWGYLDDDLKPTREFSKEEIVPSFVLEKQFEMLKIREEARKRLDDQAFINKERLDVD